MLIKISPIRDEKITLGFKGTSHGHFTLYTIPKEIYVAFYDWPKRTITNFGYQKLDGKEKIKGEDCWKVKCWEVEDALKGKGEKPCWDSEWYYAEKKNYFSYVAKNFRRRGEKGKIITSEDKEWNEPPDKKYPTKIKTSRK